ncbi:MAG: hypothetical protein ABL899_00625 [Nitrospira sp.]
MQRLIDLYKTSGNLHHAYFLVGQKVEEIISDLQDFLDKVVKVNTVGNPDFQHLRFNNMTIDDARVVTNNENRKNVSGNIKVFVIETDFITIEAQNALLKVFEEPTVGTHFFIVSPQDILLPTLRSRVQVVLHDSFGDSGESILSLSLKDRLEKVKEITDGISDEEKTKQDAITFLNQVESELYKNGVDKKTNELKVCQITRSSLYDRGAPVKMILENLVLSI